MLLTRDPLPKRRILPQMLPDAFGRLAHRPEQEHQDAHGHLRVWDEKWAGGREGVRMKGAD